MFYASHPVSSNGCICDRNNYVINPWESSLERYDPWHSPMILRSFPQSGGTNGCREGKAVSTVGATQPFLGSVVCGALWRVARQSLCVVRNRPILESMQHSSSGPALVALCAVAALLFRSTGASMFRGKVPIIDGRYFRFKKVCSRFYPERISED